MEHEINQLYEIEAAAVKIMENTIEQKRELAEAAEAKIKDFDKKLQEETSEQLEIYAKELNEQSAAKLQQLEDHTAELIKSMEDIYINYHDDIVKRLLEAILI